MHAVAGDELPEMQAELVVRVCGHVMELVHRDQPVVERFHSEPVHGKAEGCVGADQNLAVAGQKGPDRTDLASIVGAGRVTEVPSRGDGPVSPEAELAQRLVMEARADGFLRHDDDRLAEALIVKLVEGDEHQRAAFARGGRRLDQQVLFAPLLVGTLLHRPHAERVGLRRDAATGVSD